MHKERCLQLTIYCSEGARLKGRPIVHGLIALARESGISASTVYRGIEGYGKYGRLKSWRFFEVETELPIIVEFIDTEPVIHHYVDKLAALDYGGLVTVEEIDKVTFS